MVLLHLVNTSVKLCYFVYFLTVHFGSMANHELYDRLTYLWMQLLDQFAWLLVFLRIHW